MIFSIPIFFISAFLEIIGSYLAIKFMRTYDPIFLLSGTIILTLFGLSLSYHTEESGRVFAVYGGIYIASSIIWLKIFDDAIITKFDILGMAVAIIGALIIWLQPN